MMSDDIDLITSQNCIADLWYDKSTTCNSRTIANRTVPVCDLSDTMYSAVQVDIIDDLLKNSWSFNSIQDLQVFEIRSNVSYLLYYTDRMQ